MASASSEIAIYCHIGLNPHEGYTSQFLAPLHGSFNKSSCFDKTLKHSALTISRLAPEGQSSKLTPTRKSTS